MPPCGSAAVTGQPAATISRRRALVPTMHYDVQLVLRPSRGLHVHSKGVAGTGRHLCWAAQGMSADPGRPPLNIRRAGAQNDQSVWVERSPRRFVDPTRTAGTSAVFYRHIRVVG